MDLLDDSETLWYYLGWETSGALGTKADTVIFNNITPAAITLIQL